VIHHGPIVRRVGWVWYLGRMGKKKITSRAVAGITAATVSAAIVCGDEKEHPHIEVSPPAIAATPPAWAGPVADRIQIVATPPS
jgi:hypothetical protein